MASILDRFNLSGQVAIVTGSGRGIGAATAIALADAGADVVVTARTIAQLEDTAAQIRQRGRQALIVACDVLEQTQRQQLLDKTLNHFGRLDILVNNVGGSGAIKPTLLTSEEELEQCFKLNTTTAFAMSRLCAPAMVKTANKGAIVNISSVAGHIPQSGFLSYGVGKAAMNFMTANLAQDFAPHVRVNAISVGSTLTDALKGVMNDQLAAKMVAQVPMNRLGQPEDIAACALFLASPAASYITGEIYGVNGGITVPPMAMPRADFSD
ncbi:7-alpha-hydroxysteroid dehydrogenase [Colwellia chukchiensis]|uniref:7-alpha-hydroxysteroid dehydrogenase n=1 Tax=Colwellia chukchiensis TaxID=641665 RepID=A0A1H7MS47_9GAMM|nr:SDR family oxidoreductase [Colwellia chukchiensis]SEL14033.1 7-alpha-hydroxysteroid dehydrogenase [Colwellia chukchiensis]